MTTPADPQGGTTATVTQTPVPATPVPVFTQEQIEKARKDEHDKAAKETSRLKKAFDDQAVELKKFQDAAAERENAEAEATKAAADKAKAEAEEELSAKELLSRRDAEHAAELAALSDKFEKRFALSEMERRAQELIAYAQTVVGRAQAEKLVAPQFVDYVSGTTKEEIDASLQLAIQKTEEIKAEFKGARGARQSGPPQGSGVSTATGPSSMGSVSEGTDDEIDVRGMSFDDFVKNVRPKLGIGQQGQGLFG